MQEEEKKKLVEAAYRDYGKAIFRFCYLKVSDYAKAEDITSQTFLRLWEKIQKGQEIKNTKTMLYVIANGLIIDFYRSKKEKNHVTIDTIDERVLQYSDKTEEHIDIGDAIQEVYQKLQYLKEEYKEILVFHYIEELTVKEMSGVLGKNENTVRVLLHRALQALKKQYE